MRKLDVRGGRGLSFSSPLYPAFSITYPYARLYSAITAIGLSLCLGEVTADRANSIAD